LTPYSGIACFLKSNIRPSISDRIEAFSHS